MLASMQAAVHDAFCLHAYVPDMMIMQCISMQALLAWWHGICTAPGSGAGQAHLRHPPRTGCYLLVMCRSQPQLWLQPPLLVSDRAF